MSRPDESGPGARECGIVQIGRSLGAGKTRLAGKGDDTKERGAGAAGDWCRVAGERR